MKKEQLSKEDQELHEMIESLKPKKVKTILTIIFLVLLPVCLMFGSYFLLIPMITEAANNFAKQFQTIEKNITKEISSDKKE